MNYAELKKFEEHKKQLDTLCRQLFQIIQECTSRDVIPESLAEELGKISQKLQSQRFCLAVIGEFSQGKLTLINALLHEEIQPVRAIACSGTITVLKYGLQKQILCYYKDGHQESLSFEQYQILAAISKQAARQYRYDELANSEIEEIIFEHPGLDLCKNGVEIVDSPGLNEHPERAAVTQRLLKDVDAVIFITDASRALTQGERDLIHELKTQLNNGRRNEPITNLFLVVNKMDQLDSEDDRQDVQELVKEFAYGKSSILAGDQRLHFISAKAALRAILEKADNDYLNKFQNFVKAIEIFLTQERGYTRIKQSVTKLEKIIEDSFKILQQNESRWNDKIEFSKMEKQKTLEKIGELSRHSVRLCLILTKEMEQIEVQTIKEVKNDWNKWTKELALEHSLYKKSKNWFSNRDVVWDQHGIIEDFTKLFIEDLSNEINIWLNKNFVELLKLKIENLDSKISSELKAIDDNLLVYNQYNYLSSQQKKIQFDFDVSQKGLYGDLWRWIICILGVGYSFGSADEIREQMKNKVIQECLTQFNKSSFKIIEEVCENISPALDSKYQSVNEIMTRAISNLETCLEQQEIEYKKILEQSETEKAWVVQKCQELKQVQDSIKRNY